MAKRAIVPPEFRAAAEQLKMSPAIVSGDHVFLTGVTGSDARGHMPGDPETQIRNAFEKIGLVLRAGGLTFRSVVEMTTYHVDLRKHLEAFINVKDEHVSPPYPAWTAIGVSGLITEGTLVEIRIIARRQ